MTDFPVETFVRTTVPAVEEVEWTVTVMVFPAEMAKLEKSMEALGYHSYHASYETLPPLTVKSTPAWRMEFWAVSPSIPTHADAAPVPLGVGTTNVPVTVLKVCPEGGLSRTAPDQLVLYEIASVTFPATESVFNSEAST